MTDNEIIKALPFLAKYCKNEYNDIRVDEVLLGAFDLINRQKAEIERLQDTLNATIAGQETLQRYIATAKSDAIKEFVERLKEKSCKFNMCHNDIVVKTDYQISDVALDNLVKEMVGEDK